MFDALLIVSGALLATAAILVTVWLIEKITNEKFFDLKWAVEFAIPTAIGISVAVLLLLAFDYKVNLTIHMTLYLLIISLLLLIAKNRS